MVKLKGTASTSLMPHLGMLIGACGRALVDLLRAGRAAPAPRLGIEIRGPG